MEETHAPLVDARAGRNEMVWRGSAVSKVQGLGVSGLETPYDRCGVRTLYLAKNMQQAPKGLHGVVDALDDLDDFLGMGWLRLQDLETAHTVEV